MLVYQRVPFFSFADTARECLGHATLDLTVLSLCVEVGLDFFTVTKIKGAQRVQGRMEGLNPLDQMLVARNAWTMAQATALFRAAG